MPCPYHSFTPSILAFNLYQFHPVQFTNCLVTHFVIRYDLLILPLYSLVCTPWPPPSVRSSSYSFLRQPRKPSCGLPPSLPCQPHLPPPPAAAVVSPRGNPAQDSYCRPPGRPSLEHFLQAPGAAQPGTVPAGPRGSPAQDSSCRPLGSGGRVTLVAVRVAGVIPAAMMSLLEMIPSYLCSININNKLICITLYVNSYNTGKSRRYLKEY